MIAIHASARGALCGAVLLGLLAAPAPSQDEPEQPAAFEPGRLFGRVSRTLLRSFYDRAFRRDELPGLVEVYRPIADASPDLQHERIVVDSFLSHVPASHLALYENRVYQHMTGELANRRRPQLGFEFEQRGGDFVVYRLYEGGPAAAAGVLKGDRLVAVDGVPVHRSPRRSGSSDDAALDDPPLHMLYVDAEGEQVELLLERRPGQQLRVRVTARRTCSLEAAENSRRVIESAGVRIGYVHLWYFHISGATAMVAEALRDRFAGCDALILDLRGRGGNAAVVYDLLGLLDGKRAIWNKPVVCLVDRCTRSGKEAFAYEFKQRGRGVLVGEKTPGALVPASFVAVGSGYTLMFPSFTLGELSKAVELIGIEPDVSVADAGKFSAGADPILEAGVRSAVAAVAGAERGK